MALERRLVVVVVLLVLSLVAYAMGAWSYFARVGVVYGTVIPGGFRESFSIDMGVIYAGYSKTVNASVEAVIPEDTSLVFYGVATPYYVINDSVRASESSGYWREPSKNASGCFNYTVLVFMDGNYLGSFSQDNNLTVVVSRGEHEFLFIVTVYAPPSVTEPYNFTLEIWVVSR